MSATFNWQARVTHQEKVTLVVLIMKKSIKLQLLLHTTIPCECDICHTQPHWGGSHAGTCSPEAVSGQPGQVGFGNGIAE